MAACRPGEALAQRNDSLLGMWQERVDSGGQGGGYGRSVEPLARADLAARVGAVGQHPQQGRGPAAREKITAARDRKELQ